MEAIRFLVFLELFTLIFCSETPSTDDGDRDKKEVAGTYNPSLYGAVSHSPARPYNPDASYGSSPYTYNAVPSYVAPTTYDAPAAYPYNAISPSYAAPTTYTAPAAYAARSAYAVPTSYAATYKGSGVTGYPYAAAEYPYSPAQSYPQQIGSFRGYSNLETPAYASAAYGAYSAYPGYSYKSRTPYAANGAYPYSARTYPYSEYSGLSAGYPGYARYSGLYSGYPGYKSTSLYQAGKYEPTTHSAAAYPGYAEYSSRYPGYSGYSGYSGYFRYPEFGYAGAHSAASPYVAKY